jgi:outer membrane lipoprotein-sorting protein
MILLSLVAAASAFAQTPKPEPANKQAPQAPSAAKPAEALPTVDQILDKYVQAIGGKAAVQKMNSSVSKGTLEIVEAGISAPIEVYAKAPNKLIAIVTVPGYGVVLEGYDGATAWAKDPQTGMRDKAGAELAAYRRDADFYREIKLKELYTKMEVKGKQKVGEREVYLVEATPAEGSPDKYYFDTQSGLIVRMDQVIESPLGQLAFESYLEDYRDVDGIKVAFLVRRTSSAVNLTIKFDEVKHNVAIEDAKFAKPAAQ